jgi:hypothetical protein
MKGRRRRRRRRRKKEGGEGEFKEYYLMGHDVV